MRPSSESGSQADAASMQRFHYPQELRRTMHLFGSFAVAFSFISVTTGIFANFELVLDRCGPAGFWTWPLVVIGQFLVACVFADLSARMPLTGYAYQWVGRIAGRGLGWFAGWVSVCFLTIVIPSVDHGIASLLGHVSDIPLAAASMKWLVCGLIGLQAVIQIFGVRLADRINSAAVFTEVIGIVGLVIVLAVMLVQHPPSHEILWAHPELPSGQSYLPIWIMGILLGAYTIVGFESAANLAEETLDAANTVPKAILGSVIVSGVVGMAFLLVTILSIDDLGAVIESPHPLPSIIEHRLGREIGWAFFALVGISIFACGLVVMASGSRMIFAMARDGAFVGNRWLGRVSPTTGAPVPAIVLVAGLAMIVELFSESLAQLLAAAAILPAIVYLVTVLAYLTRHRALPAQLGRFTLGRWGRPIAGCAAIWLVLMLGLLSIPAEFRSATWASLLLCLAGVLIYNLSIRRRLAWHATQVSAASTNTATRATTTRETSFPSRDNSV